MSRPNPKTVRPAVGKAQYIADKLTAEGKWNETINNFLESLGDDSPAMLQLEIDQSFKKKSQNDCMIADLVKQNKVIENTIAFKQSRLNSFIHRDAGIDKARKTMVDQWNKLKKNGLRGEVQFCSWLEGPANREDIMNLLGFKNAEQAVVWLKAKEATQ